MLAIFHWAYKKYSDKIIDGRNTFKMTWSEGLLSGTLRGEIVRVKKKLSELGWNEKWRPLIGWNFSLQSCSVNLLFILTISPEMYRIKIFYFTSASVPQNVYLNIIGVCIRVILGLFSQVVNIFHIIKVLTKWLAVNILSFKLKSLGKDFYQSRNLFRTLFSGNRKKAF